ncbi:rhodanese-like domain-containing protein [Mucilaginibacter sp.]|uniref:rhodanese-like domain-containing protein n=1 Tax=Mucilaginibacter sp. TaxID=1882438 RepID=UPI003B00AC45
MDSEDIQAKELLLRLKNQEKVNLLDVREPIEFATYNIGGKNIPLGKLQPAIIGLDYTKNEEIIVICKMGLRSETGTRMLRQNGFTKVRNLEGGLLALHKIR